MTPRRVAVATATLLLLFVAGVWAVPEMLDWSRFRDDIAAIAGERLGRPVRIGGGVSLQLLPQPVLTAHDVVVEDAGDGLGLQAQALRVGVSLPSLLGGTLRASDLVLQGADFRLPWPLPPALSQGSQTWFTGLRARVADSRLRVGDLLLAGMDATLATDPDTGTLSMAGTAELRRGQAGAGAPQRWQITARLGQPGGDGAAGLDLSLDGQGMLRDTGGTFSGQIAADGTLAGRVAGRGPDLSLLLPVPAQPWRGDGRLGVGGGLVVADELGLVIGGVPARGAVALRVLPEARLDVSVTAGRLDGDVWLPALLRGRTGLAGVPMGLDLSAEAATLAGGTLRQLRGAIDLPSGDGGGTITLRDVSAVLPGDARLAVTGTVAGPSPQFVGTVRVQAPDLQATLRWAPWFPATPSLLPATALRTLDATAQVEGDATQVRVSSLTGAVDGNAVSGTLSFRPGARPGVKADLSLAFLPLDAWAPLPAHDGLAAWTGQVLAALRRVDADVQLRADDAAWAGVRLGPLALELQTDAARVALRRLAASPLGSRLTASGTVTADGRLADGRLDLFMPDLGLLRPMLGGVPAVRTPAERLLRGPGSMSVQAAGPPDALAGRVVAEGADLRLDLQPVVNLPARQVSGAVTMHHPGAPRLLETLGLGGTAAWLGDGSLSLVGQVAAGPGRVELLGGTLAAGALRLRGHLVLEGRHVSGQVAADTLPLPLLYPRSPEPLPFDALQGWSAAVHVDAAEVTVGLSPWLTQASADMALDKGVLTLGRFTARALGGAVAGSVTMDASASPPRVGVQGTARGLGATGPVFDTPVDLVAGLSDLVVDLTATGFSPAALLATVSGTASLSVTAGTVAGFGLAAVQDALSVASASDALAAARSAVTTGSSPVKRLDMVATLDHGTAELDGSLRSDAGTAGLRGSLDLGTAALDARITLRPDVPPGLDLAPELGLHLSGVAGTVTRSPELTGVVRWLAQRPAP